MSESHERFLRNAHILARLVEHVFERGYLRRASRDTITFGQLNILKFVARPGRSLVKDVARFLNASNAAASKAVSRLERKGLAKCTRYPGDRRAERVEATPRGLALIRKYERVKKSRLKTMLKGRMPDELSKDLERVIALLMRDRAFAGNPCLGCGAYYSRACMVRAFGQHCPCHMP
ncbi:MAG: winged helix-turn-helix transcriptional regulator [Planctomycetes bacterium]|nr:winged helix-turn-helix transcriptional regulator [Planctomycetota bacterium]